MAKPPTTKEERLAAALRDNLKRRKAQARDEAAMPPSADDEPSRSRP